MTLSSSVHAQGMLTERIRVQGGYTTEARPAPQPRIDDLFVMAVPEVSWLWGEKTTLLSLTYTLTGALHSLGGASEIANRVALAAAFELSRRTTLVFSAFGAQTTLSNFLISQPAAGSTLTLYPGIGTRLITVGAAEGLAHDLTPRVRVDQEADASVVTTLAPSPPLDSFFIGAGAGIERIWPKDALGAEVRSVYATVNNVPPTPDQQFVTLSFGPRWRHDWSPSLSSLVTAGAVAAFGIEPKREPLLAPNARGSLLYMESDSSLELSVATGFTPSFTGLLTQSHQATLRGTTPISRHARVYAGASVGYLRANVVNLTDRKNDQTYDAGLADVDVLWQATPLLQVFARYQFIAQIGAANAVGADPSFLRDSFLAGIQLSSRPPNVGGAAGAGGVPTQLPRRVDRGDVQTDADASRSGTELRDSERTPPAGTGGSRWIHITPRLPPQEEERHPERPEPSGE